MPDGTDFSFSRLVDSDFADVDLMCSTVRDWDLDFSALAQPVDGANVGRVVQTVSGGILFGHARFSVNLEQHGAPPAGHLTFVVMEEDMQSLWIRGRDLTAQDVLVFPVGSEMHSISGSDFNIHTISVTQDFCEAVAEAYGLARPGPSAQPGFFRASPLFLANLRNWLRRLRESVAGAPVAASDAIAACLVRAWIRAAPGAEPGSGDGRARELAVRRVLARMDGADWSQLNAAELYAHAGVSERTLQYAFLERFGLTPGAFLKARRLAAVRSALKQARDGGGLVTDIASQFGFWHTGQFARDYRRAFGELPSDTIARDAAGQGAGKGGV